MVFAESPLQLYGVLLSINDISKESLGDGEKCGPCQLGVPHIQGYYLGHPGVTIAVYNSVSLEIKSLKTRMVSYFSECPLSLS